MKLMLIIIKVHSKSKNILAKQSLKFVYNSQSKKLTSNQIDVNKLWDSR